LKYKTKVKRDLIESIEEFPKTTNALASDCHIHYNTAKNRLQELKDDGIIIKEGRKWRLNK
jgi:DNA-binding transcriptional regulator YhcF (GntR family)